MRWVEFAVAVVFLAVFCCVVGSDRADDETKRAWRALAVIVGTVLACVVVVGTWL